MSQRQELMSRIKNEYSLARQYVDMDAGSGLNKCRIIAEIILSQVWTEVNESPCTITSLDILNQQLTKEIPKEIKMHVLSIQHFGNFGSHYHHGEQPTKPMLQACLISTSELISWFDPAHKKVDPEPIQIEEVSPDADEELVVEKKTHDSTIREMMHSMVKEKNLTFEDVISSREILEWFRNKGSTHADSAITTHVQMMTTNGETRLFHKLREDGSDELFFRIKKGQFRLFNKGLDPAPITEIEQFSGWQDKLLIVNTSSSFDEVTKYSSYMSPNRAGNYKLSRSKFIGLYSKMNIPIVAEIVAKVTFKTERSKGFVWWKNVHGIDEEIIAEAKSQIDRRNREDWDEPFPVQVLLFRNQVETEFTKDTPGGLYNNNRSFPAKNSNTVEELATKLHGVTWTEWLEN